MIDYICVQIAKQDANTRYPYHLIEQLKYQVNPPNSLLKPLCFDSQLLSRYPPFNAPPSKIALNSDWNCTLALIKRARDSPFSFLNMTSNQPQPALQVPEFFENSSGLTHPRVDANAVALPELLHQDLVYAPSSTPSWQKFTRLPRYSPCVSVPAWTDVS